MFLPGLTHTVDYSSVSSGYKSSTVADLAGVLFFSRMGKSRPVLFPKQSGNTQAGAPIPHQQLFDCIVFHFCLELTSIELKSMKLKKKKNKSIEMSTPKAPPPPTC